MAPSASSSSGVSAGSTSLEPVETVQQQVACTIAPSSLSSASRCSTSFSLQCCAALLETDKSTAGNSRASVSGEKVNFFFGQQSVAKAGPDAPSTSRQTPTPVPPPAPSELSDSQQWPSLPSIVRRASPELETPATLPPRDSAERSSPSDAGCWAQLFRGEKGKMAFKDLSRADASDAGYSLAFVAALPLADTSSLLIIGGHEYFNKLSGLALCSRSTPASNAAAACAPRDSDPGDSTTLLVADAGNTRIHRFSINGTVVSWMLAILW